MGNSSKLQEFLCAASALSLRHGSTAAVARLKVAAAALSGYVEGRV